jgi:hypothetical protein
MLVITFVYWMRTRRAGCIHWSTLDGSGYTR